MSAGIPADELVVVKTDVPNDGRGTWVHPQVAYHPAMWCGPPFAVKVLKWIHDLRTKGCATALGVQAELKAVQYKALDRGAPGRSDAGRDCRQ